MPRYNKPHNAVTLLGLRSRYAFELYIINGDDLIVVDSNDDSEP